MTWYGKDGAPCSQAEQRAEIELDQLIKDNPGKCIDCRTNYAYYEKYNGKATLCFDCTFKKYKRDVDRLSEIFHEPVLPLSKFCKAMEAWVHCIEEGVKNNNNMHQQGYYYHDQLGKILTDIRKSGLLSRLLHEGQNVRTEMCPVHKGKMNTFLWVIGGDECCDGSGWLEERIEDRTSRSEHMKKFKENNPQYYQQG